MLKGDEQVWKISVKKSLKVWKKVSEKDDQKVFNTCVRRILLRFFNFSTLLQTLLWILVTKTFYESVPVSYKHCIMECFLGWLPSQMQSSVHLALYISWWYMSYTRMSRCTMLSWHGIQMSWYTGWWYMWYTGWWYTARGRQLDIQFCPLIESLYREATFCHLQAPLSGAHILCRAIQLMKLTKMVQ